MTEMRTLRTLRAIGLAALSTLATSTSAQLDSDVARRVTAVSRATTWRPTAAIRIGFDTFHPQGMVKVGENFFVSSVEVRTEPKKLAVPLDGHAYDTGTGVGHLFKIGPDGRLLSDLILGEGSIYHPGGIDFDGTSIWVPVSEYRPDSRAIVYKVAPETMTATAVLTVADHIGGIVHDVDGRRLVGISWGSRRFYAWPDAPADRARRGSTSAPVVNPTSYIDYQDCHGVSPRHMLCGGLADYRPRPEGATFALGGLELVDLGSFRPVWQTPIPLWSPTGRAMTQNPFWAEATATGLRLFFMPDDDVSTIYAYDAIAGSPWRAIPSRRS